MDQLKRSRSETPSTIATTPSKRPRPAGLLNWLRDKFGPGESSSTRSASRPSSANSVRSIPLSSDTDPDSTSVEAYGGRSNPIDVDEDYEEEEEVHRPVAGPSRFRRPNLSGQGLVNDYSGLATYNPADTPVRATVVLGSRRARMMRRFRDRTRQYGGGRRAERGLEEGRQAEAEIAKQGSATALQQLRRRVRNFPLPFKKLEPYKTPTDLEEQLERFAIHVQEDEARVQEALKTPIPDSLSADQMAIVKATLANGSFKKVIGGKAEVNAGSIRRLQPTVWLNDEIINAYGILLQQRADADETLPSLHYLNSFFYQKMTTTGYNKMLARWTKKVDIFAKDRVLFPVNLGSLHWTAAVIDMKNHRVEYFDSLSRSASAAESIFEVVMSYLRSEWKDKGHPGEFDESEWSVRFDPKAPQQDNGSDCGVFSCQTLEAASRGVDVGGGAWEFDHKNMGFMRQMMIWEIAQGELYPRWSA